MSALDYVIIAVVLVLLVLAAGGVVASRRREALREERRRERLKEANTALAAARASDRGWERARLEAAAREAFGRDAEALHLVQVVDRPGTDSDEAVFEAVSAGEVTEVRLKRTGDDWHSA